MVLTIKRQNVIIKAIVKEHVLHVIQSWNF